MNRIIVKPLEGLCNRIRVILTAHVIAQIYNKTEVMVCWGPGAGFSNDSWESLFNYPIYNISINEYTELKENGLAIHELTSRNPNTYEITQLRYFAALDQQDLVYEGCQELQLYLTQKERDFLMKQGFDWMLQQEYQSLRPSSAVRKIIKQVKFERQNTIGLHIRRGDAILSQDAHQYLSSQDAQFHNYVRNAIKHYPDIRFYLATDSEAVLKKFIQEYEDKILYLEKEFVPSNVNSVKNGQLDAAAELFLLSKTRKVIGTNFSSFSDVAAKMGNVALSCPKSYVPRNTVVQDDDPSGNLSRVSVVVAVMNRKERLLRTLPTWLAHSNVDEVVIVDWSSDEPLLSVAEIDPRIRIVRVEGEDRWLASAAFGLAIREAKNQQVLKMDCDFTITDDFFMKNCLVPNVFYSGGPQTPKIWGLLYVNKHDFLAVNGYNERIMEYGWEDEDCYQRLQNSGITRLPCHPDTASHLPHGHDLRTIHQPGVDCTTSPEKMKQITQRFPPWGNDDKPSTYQYINTSNTLVRDPGKPRLFIYGRPSTDWDSLDSEVAIETAYQFIAQRSHQSTLLKENMEYWHEHRKHFTYPEFRDALKHLAAQNLSRTEIPFIEYPYDLWPKSPAVILLPIDDDDWLSPNIQQRVLKEFRNPDVDFVVWKDYVLNSVDRVWEMRHASIESVGSCSYAIRATAATLELLLWHMDMIGILKTLPPNKYRLINDEALAVYNLHPGGAWFNTQRTQKDYEKNAHIPLPPCPQDVAWATQEHFRLTRILQQLERPIKQIHNKPINRIDKPIEPYKTKKIF